jgi:hypothetical protein
MRSSVRVVADKGFTAAGMADRTTEEDDDGKILDRNQRPDLRDVTVAVAKPDADPDAGADDLIRGRNSRRVRELEEILAAMRSLEEGSSTISSPTLKPPCTLI